MSAHVPTTARLFGVPPAQYRTPTGAARALVRANPEGLGADLCAVQAAMQRMTRTRVDPFNRLLVALGRPQLPDHKIITTLQVKCANSIVSISEHVWLRIIRIAEKSGPTDAGWFTTTQQLVRDAGVWDATPRTAEQQTLMTIVEECAAIVGREIDLTLQDIVRARTDALFDALRYELPPIKVAISALQQAKLAILAQQWFTAFRHVSRAFSHLYFPALSSYVATAKLPALFAPHLRTVSWEQWQTLGTELFAYDVAPHPGTASAAAVSHHDSTPHSNIVESLLTAWQSRHAHPAPSAAELQQYKPAGPAQGRIFDLFFSTLALALEGDAPPSPAPTSPLLAPLTLDTISDAGRHARAAIILAAANRKLGARQIPSAIFSLRNLQRIARADGADNLADDIERVMKTLR